MKKQISYAAHFDVYDSVNELSDIDRKLLEAATKAKENAYAPYSKFKVGAAVLLEDGEIVTGNNQENAAYPSGLCAERVAIFYASAQYPDKKIIAVAISASSLTKHVKKPVPPCGACRQAIAEYEIKFKKPIRLIFSNGKDSVYVCASISDLLPFMFTQEDLK